MCPRLAVSLLGAGLLAGCAAPRVPSARLQTSAARQREALLPLEDVALKGRQLAFGAGLRAFDDEELGRLDDQLALVLDYCEPMGLERVRLEGGLHYSYDEDDGTAGGEDVRLKAESFELSAGVNLATLIGRLRPYAGIGASFLFFNLRGIDDDDDTVFDDDDATAGGYLKVGLLFQISPISQVGLELRHFEGGDVTLGGSDLSTRYDQFVLVFGTSFP